MRLTSYDTWIVGSRPTWLQGIFHRANGLAVVAVELAVFALPFSVVQVG